MPVTNLASGITYRNINCAVCHRDIPTSGLSSHNQLRFWYLTFNIKKINKSVVIK